MCGFGEVIGEGDFLYHFRGMIVRCWGIGCGTVVLRLVACLVVDPIGVSSFAYLFNCTTVGWASD